MITATVMMTTIMIVMTSPKIDVRRDSDTRPHSSKW